PMWRPGLAPTRWSAPTPGAPWSARAVCAARPAAGTGPDTVRRRQHRTGGKIVLDQLAANGIDAAFCLPGESFLALLDALYDAPTRLITCRHEAAAAHMSVC